MTLFAVVPLVDAEAALVPEPLNCRTRVAEALSVHAQSMRRESPVPSNLYWTQREAAEKAELSARQQGKSFAVVQIDTTAQASHVETVTATLTIKHTGGSGAVGLDR